MMQIVQKFTMKILQTPTPNYYLPMSVGIGTVKSNAAWDFVKYTNSLVGSSAQF